MKKLVLLLTIILLCGCVPKFKFEDTKEYVYFNNNRDKVTKFIVETDTLLGNHCYNIDINLGISALDNMRIKKKTDMYSTDSDYYYHVYFENGSAKTFRFNSTTLVYNGSMYELENLANFELSEEFEIDCNNGKINHNLIKTNINDEYNLYYYEIESATYLNDNKELELKDALVSKDISIDEVVSKLKTIDVIYDGGTTIYNSNGIFKDDLELVKCKTLEGNNDVYIGPLGMGYRHNFCKNDNLTYTKTYTVKSIEDYNEQQYENGVEVSYSKSLKVLLKGYDNEEEYVILNNFYGNIEVDKTYEFELMPYYGVEIDNSIKSLFKNSIIVDAKETNKIGTKQINDFVY